MKFNFSFYVTGVLLVILINDVISQISTTINYLDKTYESEPYYYDLSFINSNFTNAASIRNRFPIRERNGHSSDGDFCDRIRRIPSYIRIDLKLSYFYQKYTEAYGIPVVGSNKVTINGLKRACYVLKFYLAGNTEIRNIFYKKNLRVVVLGASENILNIPEYDSLPSSWNFIRGLSPIPSIPLITVAEENLLCSNDKFRSEDLMVHQLSYGLLTMEAIDSTTFFNLKEGYQRALETVPWRNSFALVDIKEYLASAIDAYLGSYGKKEDFLFTLIDLKANDPYIIKIIEKIFPCDNYYINKCKASKEIELIQRIKLGKSCKNDESVTQSIYALKSSLATVTQVSSNNKISRGLNSTEMPQTTAIIQLSKTRISPFTSVLKNDEQSGCFDLNKNCQIWAFKGECVRNRQYMSLECKESCKFCEEQITTKINIIKDSTKKINISVYENFCKDDYAHCPVLALRGDCKTNPFYMLQACKRSCNLCGDLVDEKNRIHPTTKKLLIRRPIHTKSSSSYFMRPLTTVEQIKKTSENKDTTSAKHDCKDLVHYCADLAQRGDCETNKDSMAYYCAKTCRVC